DIQSFLPPPGDPLRLAALRELVRVELKERWRRGRQEMLEAFLARYPQPGKRETGPVDLIFEEYRGRQSHGFSGPVSDYQQRFPQQFPVLEQMIRYSATRAESVAASKPRPAAKATSPDPSAFATIELPKTAPVAQVVNGFKLIKKIGSGSFAEVW